MDDEMIIGVARGIERQLDSIVGEADASRLRSLLVPLLQQDERGESVADEVLAVLTGDVRVREVAAYRLDVVDTLLAAYPGGPPGESKPAAALIYACGQCDYRYPAFDVGEPVPPCPRGHGPLHRTG